MFKCNFYCVAMPIMTSQILKSLNFTKTNETLFFLQIEKLITHQVLLYGKK